MSARNKITVTPTEAKVLSELHLVAKPGDEINPNYIYPRREARHSRRRHAVRNLAEKGVLLRHPAVDVHFDIYAFGGNENIKVSDEYDPEKIRRSVRLQNSELIEASGRAEFVTKSWTQPDSEDNHHPTIDVETGAVFCDCGSFRFAKGPKNPNVWSSDEDLCKHLRRGRANLERRGVLPKREKVASHSCCKCLATDAEKYFETCDDDGVVIPGRMICIGCAQTKPKPEVEAGERAADIEETAEEAEARLQAVFEVEHPPCPFCGHSTDEIEAENGAGLRMVRICLDCGEIKNEVSA